MKVYKKLIDARIKLQATELTKSGHNKFAGYKYFELGDFLPAVQSIFKEVGLVDAISFTEEIATMVVYDVEDGSSVTFTSPMGSAQLKGCHMVQNIGAVETYQRRYLYTTALAIVEHDALDAVTGSAPVEVKPVVKEMPKESDGDLEPLAEVLITFGDTCEDLKELTSFWKKNQSGIDRMKVQKPELFKNVQEAFAQYKSKFKE